MPADIQFPRPCVICCAFMFPEDSPIARLASPGIGHVCEDCAEHAVEAVRVLMDTPGIASYMVEDGERNDICPPRFLRHEEDQP